MESFTIAVSGKTSILESRFFPPIQLNGRYQIGLKNLFSYNAMFNIKEPNNVLYYYKERSYKVPKGPVTLEKFKAELDKLGLNVMPGSKKGVKNEITSTNRNHRILNKGLVALLRDNRFDTDLDVQYDIYYYDVTDKHKIVIPPGVYEVSDLEAEMKKTLPAVRLTGDTKSFKCTIQAPVIFDFNTEGFGRSLLGFRGITFPNKPVRSESRVNINNMNVIRVHCNIASGSYLNGKETHSVYDFYPTTPPGYKMIEVPPNIIYYPIDVTSIDTFTVSFRDQNDDIIDLNNEEVTVNFHIRKI